MGKVPDIPHEIVGRGIADAEFRQRFLADPQGTLDAEGYDIELTEEQVADVEGLDPDIIEFAIHGIHKGRAEIMA